MPRRFDAELRNTATNFDTAVKDLIDKVAPRVEYSGIKISHDPQSIDAYQNMSYQVSAFLLRMPQRPDSPKFTENVFAIGLLKGIVVNKSVRLRSYSTEISYCRMQNPSNQTGELQPMAGYHYDFETTSKINHPIFHAQQKLSAGSRFFAFNDDFTCPVYPDNVQEIRTLRIPTPQMEIFSAIVMILADHIITNSEAAREPFATFLDSIHLLPVDFDNGPADVPQKFLDSHPIQIHNWYPVNRG
jgi:hypothetical protein